MVFENSLSGPLMANHVPILAVAVFLAARGRGVEQWLFRLQTFVNEENPDLGVREFPSGHPCPLRSQKRPNGDVRVESDPPPITDIRRAPGMSQKCDKRKFCDLTGLALEYH